MATNPSTELETTASVLHINEIALGEISVAIQSIGAFDAISKRFPFLDQKFRIQQVRILLECLGLSFNFLYFPVPETVHLCQNGVYSENSSTQEHQNVCEKLLSQFLKNIVGLNISNEDMNHFMEYGWDEQLEKKYILLEIGNHECTANPSTLNSSAALNLTNDLNVMMKIFGAKIAPFRLPSKEVKSCLKKCITMKKEELQRKICIWLNGNNKLNSKKLKQIGDLILMFDTLLGIKTSPKDIGKVYFGLPASNITVGDRLLGTWTSTKKVFRNAEDILLKCRNVFNFGECNITYDSATQLLDNEIVSNNGKFNGPTSSFQLIPIFTLYSRA